MRNLVVALGLAAVSAAAFGQEAAAPAEGQASAWQLFENDDGKKGAIATATDGSQLVLKCDKPGRREVHAIILAPSERLSAPTTRPVSRPIWFQFDGNAPKTERWGFFEHYAIAQGKTPDRTLARFVVHLRGSSKVRMRLDTGIGPDVELDFNVAGSEAAIAQVYERFYVSAPT